MPPGELMKTSLRQPARATPSPIAVNTPTSVSNGSVSVPGYSACSSEAPIVCGGRNSTGQSAGARAIARFR